MKRTLVIKLGALGDVALALPFLRRLALDSSANSAVVTTPPFVPLVQAAGIGEIIVLRKRSWLATASLGWQLRGRGFERVVDLQGNRASRWLTWMTGAAERVGPWPGWPYTLSTNIPRRPAVHVEGRFNQLAERLQLGGDRNTRVALPAVVTERVAYWLAARKLAQKKLVLMHAGCSPAWVSKRWPSEYFAQVAGTLGPAGYEVIWLGTQEEGSLNAELASKVGTDATNAFSLVELLALAGNASFALTNDSGPMHVLAAGGLPVYALFGPVNADRSHATGQRDRVLERELPCRPCYAKVCQLPGRSHDCLAGLRPEMVLARLRLDGWLR